MIMSRCLCKYAGVGFFLTKRGNKKERIKEETEKEKNLNPKLKRIIWRMGGTPLLSGEALLLQSSITVTLAKSGMSFPSEKIWYNYDPKCLTYEQNTGWPKKNRTHIF